MKKISYILMLSLILSCFAFYSCTQKPTSDDGKFTIVCSIFPQYDFCKVITGGEDEVVLLIRNGVDMHSYEPTSKDILTVAKADMFVYTGGESDTWVDGVLRSADNQNLKVTSLFDYADLVCSDHEHHHEHEHEHDHEEEYDEHVWTSPKNAIKIVEGLCEALCEANPNGSERYRKNTEEYIDLLEELDSQYEELFSDDITLIVGDRFPFLYLAHDYGVNYHAAFSGCSSETGASFETILSLIEEVKNNNVGVVFDTDKSGSDVALKVAEVCGAKVETLYSCQSVTSEQLGNGESYLTFMKKNLETLREAYSNAYN